MFTRYLCLLILSLLSTSWSLDDEANGPHQASVLMLLGVQKTEPSSDEPTLTPYVGFVKTTKGPDLYHLTIPNNVQLSRHVSASLKKSLSLEGGTLSSFIHAEFFRKETRQTRDILLYVMFGEILPDNSGDIYWKKLPTSLDLSRINSVWDVLPTETALNSQREMEIRHLCRMVCFGLDGRTPGIKFADNDMAKVTNSPEQISRSNSSSYAPPEKEPPYFELKKIFDAFVTSAYGACEASVLIPPSLFELYALRTVTRNKVRELCIIV